MRTDRFTGTTGNPVESLEDQLKQSLRPVTPDPRFVDHLQTRLKSPATMVIERRQSAAVGMLLIAFSLFIGLALVWLLHIIRRLRARAATARAI